MNSQLDKDFGSLPQRALGITEPDKQGNAVGHHYSRARPELHQLNTNVFWYLIWCHHRCLRVADLHWKWSLYEWPEHCSMMSLLQAEKSPPIWGLPQFEESSLQPWVLCCGSSSHLSLWPVPLKESLPNTRKTEIFWIEPFFGWNNSLKLNCFVGVCWLDLHFQRTATGAFWWITSTSTDYRKDNVSEISRPHV